MYKYDKHSFERKYSVNELLDFFLNGLKTNALCRGMKFKAPDVSHLKEGKEQQMKKIADYYGKQ